MHCTNPWHSSLKTNINPTAGRAIDEYAKRALVSRSAGEMGALYDVLSTTLVVVGYK
jgi:hypothetical protein